MRTSDLDPDRLRRLAELKPDGARVLSLFLDLDPRSVPTTAARRSAITSLLDETHRTVEAAELEHDAKRALRADLERTRAWFDGEFDATGAAALALFVSGPADLFEAIKLPRSVEQRVVLDDSPYVEPLARLGRSEAVVAVLADRRNARFFAGTRDGVSEVDPEQAGLWPSADDDAGVERTHNRVTDAEAQAHFKRVGAAVRVLREREGADHVLTAAPSELHRDLLGGLHAYERERHAGWLEHLDIGSAGPEDVRTAAEAVLDAVREAGVEQTLDRLRAGLGRGERAAAGRQAVRDALEQARVEVLLYDQAFAREHPQEAEHCAETAVAQSADVLVLDREEHPDLAAHDGVAAVLRF